MKFLLDVNSLIAWGWKDHPHHSRTTTWIHETYNKPTSLFFTSVIPELGFVRVSVQRTAGSASIATSATVLRNMLQSLGEKHRFLPDDLSACRKWQDWCTKANDSTDAHLLALAQKHGLQLATLDTGIPGAYIIPD